MISAGWIYSTASQISFILARTSSPPSQPWHPLYQMFSSQQRYLTSERKRHNSFKFTQSDLLTTHMKEISTVCISSCRIYKSKCHIHKTHRQPSQRFPQQIMNSSNSIHQNLIQSYDPVIPYQDHIPVRGS